MDKFSFSLTHFGRGYELNAGQIPDTPACAIPAVVPDIIELEPELPEVGRDDDTLVSFSYLGPVYGKEACLGWKKGNEGEVPYGGVPVGQLEEFHIPFGFDEQHFRKLYVQLGFVFKVLFLEMLSTAPTGPAVRLAFIGYPESVGLEVET